MINLIVFNLKECRRFTKDHHHLLKTVFVLMTVVCRYGECEKITVSNNEIKCSGSSKNRIESSQVSTYINASCIYTNWYQ